EQQAYSRANASCFHKHLRRGLYRNVIGTDATEIPSPHAAHPVEHAVRTSTSKGVPFPLFTTIISIHMTTNLPTRVFCPARRRGFPPADRCGQPVPGPMLPTCQGQSLGQVPCLGFLSNPADTTVYGCRIAESKSVSSVRSPGYGW